MSSYHPATELPAPTQQQIEHSMRLIERILGHIEQAGGVISFRDYMQHCLYEPGLGYYTAGATKLGKAGDFVTAPEISSLFGQCIATNAIGRFQQGLSSQVFEIGAGSGKLCRDIIRTFEQNGRPWQRYLILEPSADLSQRQREFLTAELSEGEFAKIRWLEQWPVDFDGLVVANEVLDAMPVNVVIKDPEWVELGVGFSDQRFQWLLYSTDSEAVHAINGIDREGNLPQQYCTEINLNYRPWFNSLSQSCRKAQVLLIDYGYEHAQYYHPQRNSGSLMCFYQHRSHPDPFVYPGLQDITAFVDFDAVADAAIDAGFQVDGLSTQADFLLRNGLTDTISKSDDPMQQLHLAQQIKTLTLPGEMGEKFKVLELTKD
jgi:SAM-dependent MidA family methyltransferase